MSSFLVYPVVSAVIGTVLYANLPTKFTLGRIAPSAKYFAETTLKKIDSEKDVLTAKEVKASDIFYQSPVLVFAVRRPGCAFCREQASALSKIVEKLNNHGVRLVGVVHETLGVDEFRPFLKGDLYFDKEKRFYGPKERWLPLWMELQIWIQGQYRGRSRLLGGVYLVNKDDMVMAHLEEEWGDQIDTSELFKAIEKIK
uniref:Peroxiredoxin-like 2A n=1 Tax=Ditylenchus dipsaci TaxID=166011 RepID=A0A915EF99_9BILA